MNLKKEKKGLISFHWILIALIGAFILLFGIMLATKTGTVEQKKQNVIAAEYLDLFFSPFSSTGTFSDKFVRDVSFPYDIEIRFVCRNGKEEMVIGEKEKARKKLNDFIYSTSLKTKKLFLLSTPFELPFRVTDFIFLINPEQKFCLLYSSAEEENFVSNMYSELSRLGNLGDIFSVYSYEERDRCEEANTKKILFSDQESDRRDVDMVIIGKGDSENKFDYGIVFFKEDNSKSLYITKAMIEAAIFSNSDVYSCNFNRLMDRIVKVASIYDKKAELLSESQEGCSYIGLMNNLNFMKGLAEELKEEPVPEKISRLYSIANKIKDKNSKLPCSQVY